MKIFEKNVGLMSQKINLVDNATKEYWRMCFPIMSILYNCRNNIILYIKIERFFSKEKLFSILVISNDLLVFLDSHNSLYVINCYVIFFT